MCERWEPVSPPPEGTIFVEEGGAQGSTIQMVKSVG